MLRRAGWFFVLIFTFKRFFEQTEESLKRECSVYIRFSFVRNRCTFHEITSWNDLQLLSAHTELYYRTTLRAPPRIDCQLYSHRPPSLCLYNRNVQHFSNNQRQLATASNDPYVHPLSTGNHARIHRNSGMYNRWLKIWNIRAFYFKQRNIWKC